MAAAFAASPMPDADDPLRRLLDRLRHEFALGPADYLRAERVRLVLAARGIRPDMPEAATWLAPILCTSRAEQDRFHAAFATLFSHPQPTPAAPLVTGDETAAADLPSPPATPGRWRIWLIGALVVALAIGVVMLMTHRSAVTVQPTATNAPAPPAVVPASPPVVPSAAPKTGIASLRPLAWLPLIGAALIVIGRRRRRMLLTRDLAPGGKGQQVQLAAPKPVLFTAPTLPRAFGALRRHRSAPGGRLNVERTVRATLRNGGLPVLRFGERPQTPEYVLLVDAAAPRDHVPLIADLLMPRLAEERVIAARYDFHGDPRRLTPVTGGGPQPIAWLADVAARHQEARVLILAEADIFFDSLGAPHPWVATVEAWARPVLLTPRAPAQWTWAERAAEELDWLVVPANSDGLAGYADRLRSGGDAALARWPRANDRAPDLPQRLDAYRDTLLDDEPLPEFAARELLVDLHAWLGADGYALLQALAVFPRIDPPLTQHLIAQLAAPSAEERSEAALMRLFRLPWMRAGRMPDWFRRALIGAMSPPALAAAVAATQSYLQPTTADGGATLMVARRGLLDWIATTPLADLEDRIFIETLRGYKPVEIGVEAPPSFARWARQEFGTGDWQVWLAGLVLAAIAFAYHDLLAALLGRIFRLPDLSARTWIGAGLLLTWLFAFVAQGVHWMGAGDRDPEDIGREIGGKAAAFVDAEWFLLVPLLLVFDTDKGFGHLSFGLGLLIPAVAVYLVRLYGERALPVLVGAGLLSLVNWQWSRFDIGFGGSAALWIAAAILGSVIAKPALAERLLAAGRIGASGYLLLFVGLAAGVSSPVMAWGLRIGWDPTSLSAVLALLIGVSSARGRGLIAGAIITASVGLVSLVAEYRFGTPASAVWLAASPADGLAMILMFAIGRNFRRWWLFHRVQPVSFAATWFSLAPWTVGLAVLSIVSIRYEGIGANGSVAITWHGLTTPLVLIAFLALATLRGGAIAGLGSLLLFVLAPLPGIIGVIFYLPFTPFTVGLAGTTQGLILAVVSAPYILLVAVINRVAMPRQIYEEPALEVAA